MTRLLAVACIALFLLGCRAPTPSLNLLAPYGSATVPPPSTGSVGTSGDYYAPPTPSTATGAPATNPSTPPATLMPGTPVGAGQLQPGRPPGAFMGTNHLPTPAVNSAVVPASYSSAATAGTASSRPTSSSSSSSSTLNLKGMPVNDATSAAVPQALLQGEPINLTQLPDAAQMPSFMRILSPGSSPTGTPTPATPTPAPATVSSGSWQTR